MRHLTITVEEDVYLSCQKLIQERELSSTINDFLKNFIGMTENDFFQEKSELEKEKASITKKLNELNSKLVLMNRKEEEAKKKAKQQTLQVLKGMRMNNPLRDIL